MKPIILLCFFVLTVQYSLAEDTLRRNRTNESYNVLRVGATTISVLIPVAQFSFEHRRNRLSWRVTAGIPIPRRYNIDDAIRGTSIGYALRVDGVLHNHWPSQSGVYWGFALFTHGFRYPHVGYFSDSQVYVLEEELDEYLLIKNTVGCLYQFGGHHYIGKHLDIDASIGVGPKLMFTQQRGRNDPSKIAYSQHYNIHTVESKLGTIWAVAMQVQLSIGYIF